MGVLKRLVYGNIWVALGACSCYVALCFQKVLVFDWHYCLLLFLVTVFAYNFQRVVKFKVYTTSSSPRHSWLLHYRKVLVVAVVTSGLFSAVLGAIIIPFWWILFSAPFLLIVLFYAWKQKGESRALRDVPLLKTFLIAIVWTWSVALLPWLIGGVGEMSIHGLDLLPYITSIFLLTFALCIPFDIRDMDVDVKKITLPQFIGMRNSVYLGWLLLITAMCIGVYIEWYALTLTCLISIGILQLSVRKRPELFYGGLVDGMFMVLLLFELGFYYFL